MLPRLRAALRTSPAAVLQAPPGAGKTTGVPLALAGEEWLAGQSIVLLEPRRLATRAAAHRLAELLREEVGHTVGYRMRGDTRVSAATRIEVVTEGVLTRRLQRDPTLDGVGLVIFDEFHERSLDADLGLALTLRTQSLVRDELRLLVMSATLDGEAVAALLGGAPIVTSEGRTFPVETRYVEPRPGVRAEAAVAGAITRVVREEAGDVLAFLPGAAEIRRVEGMLADQRMDALVLPLSGAMSRDEQDRVIRPDPAGRRKVVLATSIAETSLTIEGIRIVVDSGLARVPRHSPRTGMTRLETVRVSRSSADQRRGRAGRLGPGICIRLWAEYENAHLLPSAPPEIEHADLAPLALDLAAAGVADPLELRWLDPPAPAAYAQATELLRELDALDPDGALTAHGRAMHALPVHPRLAHMLVHARELGATRLAAELAALLSERDVVRSRGEPVDADVTLRLEFLHDARSGALLPPDAELDREVLRRVRVEADRLERFLGVANDPAAPDDAAGRLLALAYPDRVAQRRPGDRPRFVLRNGRGAELPPGAALAAAPYLVAAEVDDRRPESRVFLAAAIGPDSVRSLFHDQILIEDRVTFDDATDAVQARRRHRLGAIVLREVALPRPDPDLVRDALAGALRRRGLAALFWSDAAARLRARMAFVARHLTGWPDVSDESLLDRLDEWLGHALGDALSLNDLGRADLAAALGSLLDWRRRQELDRLAPTHLDVPSGSRIPVDYSDAESPVLAVRLQEMFGLAETPRVLDGQLPVTLHLLSPAQRPVQVTRDLGGFWRSSYADVRKDLRGRYPKHEWPEDPLHAAPTRRARRPRSG